MTLTGMSVLLAEDNPTNQMVATQMLETLGAEVTLAADGAEALEALHGRRFDFALIDIEMPRVSGLDLIRRLRADPGPVAAMPMIALTAYVMREHRAAIEGAGADGIIAKPIASIDRFGTEILGHVRKRGARPPTATPAPAGPRVDRAEADRPDFDRAVFDGLCAPFGPEARRELVSRLTEDIAAACETVVAAIRDRDPAVLRAATHVLISVAGMIGARRLQTLARRLNSAGHGPDDAGLDRDGSELLLEAERVLRSVCRRHEEAAR